MVQDLCEILKVRFEISYKILNSYTAKHAFYWLWFTCVIYDIFELWSHVLAKRVSGMYRPEYVIMVVVGTLSRAYFLFKESWPKFR